MGIFKPLPPRLQRGHPLARGLVGAWEFTEGSGPTAYDSSGYGNDGALLGGPVWTGGPMGSSLSFNGTSAYILVANPASFNFAASFSILAWITPLSLSSDQIIFAKAGPSSWNTGGKQLLVRSTTGAITLDACNIGGVTSTSAVKAGAAAFVAATFVQGTNAVALYINGSAAGSGTLALTADNAGDIVTFGEKVSSGYFGGLLSGFRMYNRALSAAEIAMLYQMTGP